MRYEEWEMGWDEWVDDEVKKITNMISLPSSSSIVTRTSGAEVVKN